MTKTEQAFKEAVGRLCDKNVYPSCTNILKEMGKPIRASRSMSAKEIAWRESALAGKWARTGSNPFKPWEPIK